jgi:hypothetical protein
VLEAGKKCSWRADLYSLDYKDLTIATLHQLRSDNDIEHHGEQTLKFEILIDRLLFWALRVYGAIALIALALVPHFFLPAEDATILFQYSRNLYQHGAIIFYAGGPHTEGATDFLWMLLISGAMRLGIPAFVFCSAINILSLLGLSLVLLRIAEIRISVWRVLAVAGAAALFPQIFAAASGFAVLPDAFLLALLVYHVLERRTGQAALTALIFCLFRPDGIVFALPLLVWLLIPEGIQERETPPRLVRTVAAIAGLFILPGLIYFAWRFRYFGELFPLPFLVKSDAHRVLGLVVTRSVHESFAPLFFVGVVLGVIAWWGNPTEQQRRKTLGLSISLILIPTAFFWHMRLDQNVGNRFFYYLPLAAALLLAVNWSALVSKQTYLFRIACVAWLLLVAMPLKRELRTFRDLQFDGVKDIAQGLGRLSEQGTILTTEAGTLPFFSGWQTYDAWGLNTLEFAHRFVQPNDVERLKADIVVVHPDLPEGCLAKDWPLEGYADRSWPHLTRNLVIGANRGGYELWLVSYGSEYYRERKRWRYGEGDRECWFVRLDSPLYAGIVRVLEQNHAVRPEDALRLEEAHSGLGLR